MQDAFPELLTRSTLARPLALAVNAALIALLVLVLARATWFVVALNTPPLPPTLPHPAATSTKPASSLASWHLFGNALPQLDPRAAAQPSRETALKLVLRGVFALDEASAGYAIVADEAGAEGSYRVGDELPGGAKLVGVYADRITLARNGTVESLSMPAPDSGGSRAAATRNASVPAAARAPLPGASRNEPFVNSNIVTNPGAWNQAAKKLDVDPAALAREIQALPVLENGKFVGVRLSGGKEAALLTRLGLQPDDIVTAVNGIQLDNPARSAEIAASLSNASTATVVVRRNGKPTTLSVSLH